MPEADDDGGSAGGSIEGRLLLLLFFNLIGLHSILMLIKNFSVVLFM